MMRTGALLFSCCALSAHSAAVGLDDAEALVAWNAKSFMTWGKSKKKTTAQVIAEVEQEKPKKKKSKDLLVWGPFTESELSFVKAVDRAVLSAYRDPKEAARRTGAEPKRTNNSLSVEWEFQKTEPQSRQSVVFQEVGCRNHTDGTQDCDMDYANQPNASRLNVALGLPLGPNAEVSFDFRVKSGFFHQKMEFKCKACGVNCEGTFLMRKFSIPMPACPIPVGTWVLTLPIPQVTNSQLIHDYMMIMHGIITRPNGVVAAEFRSNVTML